MKESTTRAPTAPNYGYLWWLEDSGSYAASGIFGQYIYIVPEHRIVVVIHGVWPVAYNREQPAHRSAFLQAFIRAVSEKSRGAR